MDLYLSSDGDLLLGGAVDLPLLSMPLTPRPVMVDMVSELSVGSPAGATLQVLDSLPGCQYRMAPYDVDLSDLKPAYGFHLHDP